MVACTQLAVHAGARVIGTTGTPGKEKRALAYGASRVVVTSQEDFEKDVAEGRGALDKELHRLGSLGEAHDKIAVLRSLLDRFLNVVVRAADGRQLHLDIANALSHRAFAVFAHHPGVITRLGHRLPGRGICEHEGVEVGERPLNAYARARRELLERRRLHRPLDVHVHLALGEGG